MTGLSIYMVDKWKCHKSIHRCGNVCGIVVKFTFVHFPKAAVLNGGLMALWVPLAHLRGGIDWKQFFTHYLIRFVMQFIQS